MSKQKKQMDAPDREQGSRVNKNTAKRLLSYIGAYKKTGCCIYLYYLKCTCKCSVGNVYRDTDR